MKKGIITAAIICLAVSVSVVAGVLPTQQDKLSYSMGVETGKAFRAQHIDISPSLFAKGLSDSMSDKKLLLSESDIKASLMEFQKQAFTKMQEKVKALSVKNSLASKAFLESNKSKEGVKVTPSGLEYKVIKAGTGARPSKTDRVTVDYEGKLIGGKIFDSSYKRGKPAVFPVNAVIQGWTEALQKMSEGSVWELYIPPELAYGKNGAPGTIGPNEALIFKVHLIKINH